MYVCMCVNEHSCMCIDMSMYVHVEACMSNDLYVQYGERFLHSWGPTHTGNLYVGVPAFGYIYIYT